MEEIKKQNIKSQIQDIQNDLKTLKSDVRTNSGALVTENLTLEKEI